MQDQSNPGPLFVVGVWRSGTSLLQALLNQHPQVGLAYEAELPLLKSLFPGGRAKTDWSERWEFWNNALTRHRIPPGSIPPADYDLASATEAVYRKFAERKGATIWGEKSPNYWDRLDEVATDFPNARFVVIFRNPVGVCRSIFQAGETPGYFAQQGMGLRALFACLHLKRQRDLIVARGIPVCDIQYEELVKDPESSLKKVCEFLGLPFDSRMTSLENADRGSFYEGQHHSLVKGDRIVASQERRDTLPPKFRAKIEAYIALWREQYQGWPLYPKEPLQNETKKPGLMGRLADQSTFWALRRLDRTVAFIYCWAPMSWLHAYRARRRPERTLVASPSSTESRPL